MQSWMKELFGLAGYFSSKMNRKSTCMLMMRLRSPLVNAWPASSVCRLWIKRFSSHRSKWQRFSSERRRHETDIFIYQVSATKQSDMIPRVMITFYGGERKDSRDSTDTDVSLKQWVDTFKYLDIMNLAVLRILRATKCKKIVACLIGELWQKACIYQVLHQWIFAHCQSGYQHWKCSILTWCHIFYTWSFN